MMLAAHERAHPAISAARRNVDVCPRGDASARKSW
jgi:hypothetical protein